jgi:hypothetical protein
MNPARVKSGIEGIIGPVSMVYASLGIIVISPLELKKSIDAIPPRTINIGVPRNAVTIRMIVHGHTLKAVYSKGSSYKFK